MSTLHIGAGAGTARDPPEPAAELARTGSLDYLAFECLAERTLAMRQREKLRGESAGYDPLLPDRMEATLEGCAEHGVTVVTNMGAAAPEAAARETVRIASDLGLDLRVASVTGSDVRDRLDEAEPETFEGTPVADLRDRVVSASAYLGVEGIVEALDRGADVVITGRVSDVSLFLAPAVFEFGWSLDPLESPAAVGGGIVAAHLVECAGHVTGGYFADPGYKDPGDLADIGFPIAEIGDAGGVTITKPPDTGGAVTERTCKEQLLYEVHDPSAYITPDAVADFTGVTFEETGDDRVRVEGATARPRTDTLKVNLCYADSIVGEGQVSYGGPGAVERAELAEEIVRSRLDLRGVEYDELHVDHVGIDSLHGEAGRDHADPYEVRLRVAGRCESREHAERLGQEVGRLHTTGPAGGGGAWTDTREVVGIESTLIDRDLVSPAVTVGGGA